MGGPAQDTGRGNARQQDGELCLGALDFPARPRCRWIPSRCWRFQGWGAAGAAPEGNPAPSFLARSDSLGSKGTGEQSVRRVSEAAGPPLSRHLRSGQGAHKNSHTGHGRGGRPSTGRSRDIALQPVPTLPMAQRQRGNDAPVTASTPPWGASGSSETFCRSLQPWPREPDYLHRHQKSIRRWGGKANWTPSSARIQSPPCTTARLLGWGQEKNKDLSEGCWRVQTR